LFSPPWNFIVASYIKGTLDAGRCSIVTTLYIALDQFADGGTRRIQG